jgi:hypothetical protein
MDHEVIPIGVGGKSGARPVAIRDVKRLAVLETLRSLPFDPDQRIGQQLHADFVATTFCGLAPAIAGADAGGEENQRDNQHPSVKNQIPNRFGDGLKHWH